MSWGPMEEFASLFAPGMRHERQRRQDLETLRDEEGNAADPLSTVDLDRGVAVIRLPRAGDAANATDRVEKAEAAEAARPAAEQPAPSPERGGAAGRPTAGRPTARRRGVTAAGSAEPGRRVVRPATP